MSSDAVTIIVSVLALVTSLAGLAVQRFTARNSDTVATTLTLFQEFRSPEMAAARRVVTDGLLKAPGQETAVNELDEDVKDSVIAVCRYFDHVGVLVAYRMVPAEPVVGYLGSSVDYHWTRLKPYVLKERERRRDDYLEYFELLSTVVQQYGSDRIQSRVRRRIEHGRI